jgi:hypothetical protein
VLHLTDAVDDGLMSFLIRIAQMVCTMSVREREDREVWQRSIAGREYGENHTFAIKLNSFSMGRSFPESKSR